MWRTRAYATLAAPLTPLPLGVWAERKQVTRKQEEVEKSLYLPLAPGTPLVGDLDALPRGESAPSIMSCHLRLLTFIEHLLVFWALSQHFTSHTLSDWTLRCKQQKIALADLNKEFTKNIFICSYIL